MNVRRQVKNDSPGNISSITPAEAASDGDSNTCFLDGFLDFKPGVHKEGKAKGNKRSGHFDCLQTDQQKDDE